MHRARCSEERARSAPTPGIAEAEPTETRFEPRDLGARCRAASPAIGHRIEGPCRAPLKRAYCSAAAERYRPARASLETAGAQFRLSCTVRRTAAERARHGPTPGGRRHG